MALVPCILISTGYILLVLFLCELARKTIAPLNDGLVKTALNEAIAAADLCGVCFELIISEHPNTALHYSVHCTVDFQNQLK